MANDSLHSLPATNTDWDKAWKLVCRLDAARTHLTRDSKDLASESPIVPELEIPSTPAETAGSEAKPDSAMGRAVRRPLSVWILIGALWISIGMIISATIVAAAYLF